MYEALQAASAPRRGPFVVFLPGLEFHMLGGVIADAVAQRA
jgi:hypothetical protein